MNEDIVKLTRSDSNHDFDFDFDSDSGIDVSSNDAVDEEKIGKLWAKELYEMPHEDREAAINELHGVQSRYDEMEYENPKNQSKALLDFNNELNDPNSGISPRLISNYLRALSMNSTYVLSPELRLRFLRVEFFDVSKAIVRFCKCLDMMVELFGDVGLLRQIFISDLTKRERKLLKEGEMQFSPSRDSLGRRTMFFLGNVGGGYTPWERDRVGLYMIYQILAEDVTTQQNGLVTVHLMSEGIIDVLGGENKPRMSRLFRNIFESLPLRFSAIHFCFPNEFISRLLKPLMILLVGNTGRKVLRIHSGTAIECKYSLSSFGIRQEDFPTTYSGTIKKRQHMRWLKFRATMDEYIKQQCKENSGGDYRYFYGPVQYATQPFPRIYCPEINCVLFHKNGVAREFPGNIKFRAFLDEQLRSNYPLNNRSPNSPSTTENVDFSGSSMEKEAMVDRIIRLSLAQNFEFLLHDETRHWYVKLKDDSVLRQCIGFAIRGHRRRTNTMNNTYGNNQETRSAVFTNMNGDEHSCGMEICSNIRR